MTAKEFVSNFIMHDSLIDNVEVLDDGKTIIISIDFAFWMQNGYKECNPETGTLEVVFANVNNYTIPENVDWSAISILETSLSNDSVKFSLMNDTTDDYLELIINSQNISTVER